jgi:hypothetical protein
LTNTINYFKRILNLWFSKTEISKTSEFQFSISASLDLNLLALKNK